jgi:hypothetical protein
LPRRCAGANAVGWGSGTERSHFMSSRGRELTPTRLPPIKSGVADLPLSGGGIAELAAPLSPCAIALLTVGERQKALCAPGLSQR